MLEHDDACVGPRLALALLRDASLRPDGVADKHRARESDIGHAEIRDRGAERRVAHGQSDHQTERKDAVDDALSEFRVLGEFRVEVQRLRIVRQRGKQQIVGLGHGSCDRMHEHTANFEFIVK